MQIPFSDKINLPIIPMEMLRERYWGKFTGMSIAEAKNKYRVIRVTLANARTIMRLQHSWMQKSGC